MTPNRLADCLDHIRSAAREALGFLDGTTPEAFAEDRRTQNAVSMSLIVIGEAAALIVERYPDFAAGHPDIAWTEMRGMRNRLTHAYFDVDLAIVWNTVRLELPKLLQALEPL